MAEGADGSYILIIDDDDSIRKTLQFAIELEGYAC